MTSSLVCDFSVPAACNSPSVLQEILAGSWVIINSPDNEITKLKNTLGKIIRLEQNGKFYVKWDTDCRSKDWFLPSELTPIDLETAADIRYGKIEVESLHILL